MSPTEMTQAQAGLLETLQKRGHLTATNVRTIQAFVQRWHVPAHVAVLETCVLDEASLAEAIADCYAMPRLVQLRQIKVSRVNLERIPYAEARRLEVLPVGPNSSNGRFGVVMADPTDPARVAAVRDIIGEELTLAVADRTDIVGTIDEFYPLSGRLPSIWECDAPSGSSSASRQNQ